MFRRALFPASLPTLLGCALFVALAALAPPRPLRAAPDYTFVLPAGTKNPSGLKLVIHDCGIDANGYRPIEVEVTPRPLKPLTFDRQVRVVLEFNRYGSQMTTQVSQVIELPEGSTGEKVTILAPQTGGWSQFSARTFEGGEKLLDLSQDYLGWPNSIGWSWTEARPAILVIDSRVPTRVESRRLMQNLQASGVDTDPTYTLPDIRQLLANFPDLNQPVSARPGAVPKIPANLGPQISDTSLLALVWPRSRTELLGFEELRGRWLEMSQYDVALISLQDLEKLASAHQDRFTALREWLSTGPLLVVYGAGDDYSRLAALEQRLQLPPLPVASAGLANLRGWEVPGVSHNIGKLHSPFDDHNDLAEDPADPANQSANSPPSSDWSGTPPFVHRPAGLGRVVAIASENPFPGKQSDWAWLFNSVPENHWKWFRRTGFSLQRTNDDYWKFLIPGVGEAPVIPFMVLVSLFAIVIGPLNFLWLRRSRRLYLLLLTVPLGAVLVTASLIFFAVISDGVRVRLRVRSFADFDQTTGHAAVWSRQSYYAALAPSQGLAFPANTAVYPLAYEPGDRSSDRTTLLHWEDAQQLRRGYLAPRTATQFMTCRALTSPVRLLVTEPAAPGAPLAVENQLGTLIHHLLVRSKHGEYHAFTALPAAQRQSAPPIAPPIGYQALHDFAAPLQPADPRDYNPRLHNDNLFTLIGGRGNHLPNSDGVSGDPLISTSLLETALLPFLQHPTLASTPYQGTDPDLPPGTYVALVERSPFVEPGIPHAHEESSLHVIRGRFE